jgi:hypothetical protein
VLVNAWVVYRGMPSLRFLHDSWWLKSEIMDDMESVKIYDKSIQFTKLKAIWYSQQVHLNKHLGTFMWLSWQHTSYQVSLLILVISAVYTLERKFI